MISTVGLAGWCVSCFLLGVVFDHFFGLNRKTFNTAREAIALCTELNQENAVLRLMLSGATLEHSVTIVDELEKSHG